MQTKGEVSTQDIHLETTERRRNWLIHESFSHVHSLGLPKRKKKIKKITYRRQTHGRQPKSKRKSSVSLLLHRFTLILWDFLNQKWCRHLTLYLEKAGLDPPCWQSQMIYFNSFVKGTQAYSDALFKFYTFLHECKTKTETTACKSVSRLLHLDGVAPLTDLFSTSSIVFRTFPLKDLLVGFEQHVLFYQNYQSELFPSSLLLVPLRFFYLTGWCLDFLWDGIFVE